MAQLLTAAQMKAVEIAAIESGETTGLELMERAGHGVVEALFETWSELPNAPFSALILCGPGNNGGDGFVVARLLAQWGCEIKLFLYGAPDKLPPDARSNYERWLEYGTTERWDPGHVAQEIAAQKHALILDALFGTGLTRPLVDELTPVVHALSDCVNQNVNTRLASVDIPSGLCADSGKTIGRFALPCHLTVTFHTQKLGHRLAEGPSLCGRVVIKDIGLRDQNVPTAPRLLEHAVENLGKQVTGQHKFSHGHALILSGGAGKTGAARLAARGALRIGAGLVTLGVPGAAQLEAASQVTAIMLKRAGTEEEVYAVLEDKRINALCLGPGLGLERARGLVEVVLGGLDPRATMLDADALTAFEGEPGALFRMLHENCVLTPHGGEFARLFPDISAKLNETPTQGPAYSKVDATREAAKRAGCVVLFKGADTVIAAPDGICAINSAHYERAVPWLATAGSGDVLAGLATGLLARGFTPFQSVETAAWLHVECARRFGPGLIAEDLPEELPGLFRSLGL